MKYQKAFNKSIDIEKKKKYKDKELKIHTIMNNLSKLEVLWNKAWDAENDKDDDRSAEAQRLFEQALKLSE